MKKLLLFLLVIIGHFVSAQGIVSQYDQLVSVNAQWKNQSGIDASLKSIQAKQLTEQQLVQFHLQQTELLLRKKDISHLSPAQKKQRESSLNTLHAYWLNGVFPINDQHQNRQPYFIDKHNTYCAVGYLMQQSGADKMAREIHDTQNFSYLLDINHPQLMDWAFNSGLAFDELALIQPGYFANWPSSVLEMHYNNTGTDVDEYIEIHQSSNTLFGGTADRLLFYDQGNTLYKTLLVSQMQLNNSMYAGLTYYYAFPSNESFADAGKIEIWNTSNQVSSVVTYSGSSVTVQDNYPTNGISTVRNYSVGENETTPSGTSLTFCGYYYSNWNAELKVSTTGGVVSTCTITPIGLSKFDYSINNKAISLLWETTTESNNDRFEIEKSNNGIDFEKIGSVKGAGTSNNTKQYLFVDEKPSYINQYRLKQIDLDGKFTYSKILYVKVQQANPLSIAGNPVKKQLQVSVSMESSKIGSLIIFDLMGRKMKTFKGNNGLQQLDVSTLVAGKYLLQLLTVDGQAYNQQFIKAD